MRKRSGTTLTIPTASLATAGDPWAAAVDAWLNAKEARSGSRHTRRAYAKALSDWLTFLADLDRHPGQAGGVEAGAYRDHLTGQGYRPATIAQRLAAVSSFYRFCQHRFTLQHEGREVTLIDYNPIDRAERPKVDPWAGAQKVEPGELAALLSAADRTTLQGKRDYSILVTFIFTGRRLAELARLTWGDLTQHKSRVTYRYTGKGGKRNERELPPPAWGSIGEYLTASGRMATLTAASPIWTAHTDAGQNLPNVTDHRPGTDPLSVAMIRRLINRYTAEALGRPVSPHALRHAAAAARDAAGDDARSIKNFLDHSSLDMTDRYLSRLRVDRDESWQGVAELVGIEG